MSGSKMVNINVNGDGTHKCSSEPDLLLQDNLILENTLKPKPGSSSLNLTLGRPGVGKIEPLPEISINPPKDEGKIRRPPLQRGISRNKSDPKLLPVPFIALNHSSLFIKTK